MPNKMQCVIEQEPLCGNWFAKVSHFPTGAFTISEITREKLLLAIGCLLNGGMVVDRSGKLQYFKDRRVMQLAKSK